ncbi:MAG TPA: DUF3105 domain-containing protein [Trueperaceae bacterium]
MAKTKPRAGRGRSRRRNRKNNLPWIVGITGVAALIVLPIVVNAVRWANLPGEGFRSQGNLHIALGTEHVPYNSDPPTSGPHTPNLANWGSYYEIQPDERLVHNMEDGGVILWYRHGTPEENEAHVEALEEVARGYRRVVIAPREEMPTTYALTAWQRLQRFDEIDPDGMREFIEAFEGIDHHPR